MSECCEICGEYRPHSMEDHHILPRRFGGGDHDDNLVTLCANCHAAVENIYNKDFWVSVGLRPSDDNHTVEEYIDRRLTIDENIMPVPKADIYDRYCDWCRAGDADPVSQHKFSKMLERIDDVGSERVYVGDERVRCYTGVSEKSLVDAQ